MVRRTGIAGGSAIAALGILLAVASLSGAHFPLLPAVQSASPGGASWLLIAFGGIVAGFVVAVAAAGLEADRPVDELIRHEVVWLDSRRHVDAGLQEEGSRILEQSTDSPDVEVADGAVAAVSHESIGA